jgi:hypothetical protein
MKFKTLVGLMVWTVGLKAVYAETAAAASQEPVEPAQEVSQNIPEEEGKLAVFVLDRGWYFTSDLGMFMSLGGVRGYGDVEPYLALKGGYDFNDYLGVQIGLSTGYSSGNPASSADNPNNPSGARGGSVVDYGLLNGSAELVGAYRFAERLSLEPHLGAGITRVHPALTSREDPSQKQNAVAPHIVGGVDLRYLTLLSHFSAGVTVNAYYVVGPNVFAMATGLSVRYTF